MIDPDRDPSLLGRIVPGMDVCDVGGDKVGSVAHIHRVSEPPEQAGASTPDEVIEVKTGVFGLGKHLYVPLSDVQEVLPESVFLSRPREEFESRGYYNKPGQFA